MEQEIILIDNSTGIDTADDSDTSDKKGSNQSWYLTLWFCSIHAQVYAHTHAHQDKHTHTHTHTHTLIRTLYHSPNTHLHPQHTGTYSSTCDHVDTHTHTHTRHHTTAHTWPIGLSHPSMHTLVQTDTHTRTGGGIPLLAQLTWRNKLAQLQKRTGLTDMQKQTSSTVMEKQTGSTGL